MFVRVNALDPAMTRVACRATGRGMIRSVGATGSTDPRVRTIPSGPDAIVPLAGTESIGGLELGTRAPPESARARRAPAEKPTNPRNPIWCHAHGPPSQPAVRPAASPTLVPRNSHAPEHEHVTGCWIGLTRAEVRVRLQGVAAVVCVQPRAKLLACRSPRDRWRHSLCARRR